MDSVCSVDDIADQLWSSLLPMWLSLELDSSSTTSSSKMMNKSSWEWGFQRFLQEAAAADTTTSSSFLQQIKDHTLNQNLIADQPKMLMSNTASFGSEPPPNILIDSDEYQAAPKKGLDLACAAFAMTRANYVKPQDLVSLPSEKGSLSADAT